MVLFLERPQNNGFAIVVVLLGALAGCAYGQYVTYGPQADLVGYRTVYVAADPKPGTRIHEGSRQEFAFTVNYMMLAREAGTLVLEFTDGRGEPILDDKTVSLPITRTRMREAVVRQEIVVPSGLLDVVVRVGVVPEGEHRPGGWLAIRYPTIR
jgi:hypothetical protein